MYADFMHSLKRKSVGYFQNQNDFILEKTPEVSFTHEHVE